MQVAVCRLPALLHARKPHKKADARVGAHGLSGLGFTWTPEICKIMALMAVSMGLGLFFTHFWGSGRAQGLGLMFQGL